METAELLKIQELFEKLDKKIDELNKKKILPNKPNQSDSLNELSSALAQAQSEMAIARLNQINPYFQNPYGDLESVVSASRGPLTRNGLSVTQQIMDEDDASWLITTLWHTSGQWISSRRRIVPPKSDIQTVASHTSYLKRMCYAALIGVVTEGEDDDAEKSVATERETFAKGTALNRKYNPKENTAVTITKEQLEELEYELAEYPDIAEGVLDGLKIQNLADMPKDKFMVSMRRIRQIKQMRNEGKTPTE